LFCLVFFSLLVFVLCLVFPIFPVSLDCPFLITPSVFSKDYLFVIVVCVFSSCVLCASVFSNIYFQNVRKIWRRDMSQIMSILLSGLCNCFKLKSYSWSRFIFQFLYIHYS
jgi:uncharacterized protein YqgC (DUF456 family)